MSWKKTTKKFKTTSQEGKVWHLIDYFSQMGPNNANMFCDQFNEELKNIKRQNCFSAEHGYKATPRNQHSLEIWKMTVQGDYNYLICTLVFVDDYVNPLDFL